MKIKVLFFAQLREAFETSEKDLEIEEGVTVQEVVQSLFADSKLGHLKGIPLLYSRNEKFAKGSETLRDHDTLALLPPVAGG